MTEDKLVDRIRKLLAMAEGTTNRHEAEAFMAKASELMLEHAISEAQIEAAGRSKSQIVELRIPIKASTPGNRWLRLLLNTIANTNRCRMYTYSGYQGDDGNMIVGYPDDTSFVEMVFLSLSIQLETAYAQAYEEKPPHIHGRRWRTEFTAGFVSGVSERLKRAARQAEESHSSSMALVHLRKANVDAYMDENHDLRKSDAHLSTRAGEGTARGWRASQNADLSGGKNALSSRKALPR